MRFGRSVCAAAVALLLAPGMSCECMYGGPGCSGAWVVGCDDVLVVGQEYAVVLGYRTDTGGLSEATVQSVRSESPEILEAAPTSGAPDLPYDDFGDAGPFDGNDGPGNGGVTMRPLAPGEATIRVRLRGWERDTRRTWRIVDEADAPAGFVPMSAEERLTACLATYGQDTGGSGAQGTPH
jgi:hypothetical protein